MAVTLSAPVDARRTASAAGAGPAPRIELVPCGSPSIWDALMRDTPGGTAFHQWRFLDLQERLLGVRIARYVVEADGWPVGIVPLARRGAASMRSPWLPFSFLGPAVPPELLLPTLRAVRALQWRTGLVLGRFDLAPALAATAEAAVRGAGMRHRVDGTVQLDLRHGSVDELDARMDRKRRQAIRRAERSGVHARPAEPGETARVLGRAIASAYRRCGVPNPYPITVGELVEGWAHGRDDVYLGSVFDRGRQVGSTVLLGSAPVAVGWIGACLPEARTSNAESVLVRDAFVWAIGRGIRAVDFGGRVNDEVEHFKRSFGGQPVPFVSVESFLGPYRLRQALGRF